MRVAPQPLDRRDAGLRRALAVPLVVALLVTQPGRAPGHQAIVETQPDEVDEIVRLHVQSMTAYRRGDYAEAIRAGARALALAERIDPDAPNTLTLVGNLAEFLRYAGRYAESEPLQLRAWRGQERVLGADHPDTLLAASNVAVLYHAQGRYAEAEVIAEPVLAARERVLGPDHRDTLTAAANLGNIYLERGRHADAEPLLGRVLASYERTTGPDSRDTLGAIADLASLYRIQGRYAEAEPLYLRVIDTIERTLGRETEYSLLNVDNLASLYRDQRRYAEAEALGRRALEGRERLLGREHPDTLTSLNNLATTYVMQHRYSDAEPLYLRILEASERTLGRDHPHTLSTVNNLALVYQSLDRFREAEPLLLRVAAAYERDLGSGTRGAMMALTNLAQFYESEGRYSEGAPLYARALTMSRAVQGDDHPYTIQVAAALARIGLRTKDAPGALAAARLAVSGLRSRRLAADENLFSASQSDREQLREGAYSAVLADAAAAAFESADEEERERLSAEAFTALQDASTGTATRAVTRMAVRRLADEAGTGLGSLVREREELEDRWRANNTQFGESLGESPSDPQAASRRRAWRDERARIETRMAEIDTALRRDFRQYFDLVRPQAMDIVAAKALLGPDEAFVLIVPTDFGTHIMGVTSSNFLWARSNLTNGEIAGLAARLLWNVGASVDLSPEQSAMLEREAGSGYSYDRQTAFVLYRQIFAQAEPILQGKRHVFVATAGSLTSLPLGILVTEEPRGSDADPQALRETRWLADAHVLIQLPSIQSLQFLRRYRREPGDGDQPATFVGFGDPLLAGAPVTRSGGRGRTLADAQRLRQLAPLPGTAAELQSMRQALGAPPDTVFLREQATESRLRSMDLSGTSILALATHGLMGGEIEGIDEPGLVLSPPHIASENDDGYLAASEVTTLRLNAEWVILSACNTAAGDGTADAPGLSGLARAFFYAGARNLLASHWPVRDDVAARLTVRTIALMGENPRLSRAEALQMAMREVREDPSHDGPDDSWAHPNAWAPFSLIGDGAR